MKILFITNQFNPPRSTGSGNSSALIVRELKKRDHELGLLIFDRKSFEKDYMNTPIYKSFKKSNPISIIRELLKIKDGAYDIIHQYGGGLDKYLLPMICGKFKKTKIVTTFNGIDPFGCWNYENYNNNDKTCCTFPKNVKCTIKCVRNKHKIFFIFIYLHKHIQRFYARKYDKFFALSESMKVLFSKAGFEDRDITIIPNFYDISFYEKIKKCDIKKSKNVVILYVGDLIKVKGVENLIKAFEKIDGNELELRIIGDGLELKKLKQKYGKNKKIIFTGRFPYNSEEFIKNYLESDIFVHPGLWVEAFGRTILEAALTNHAIIVSDIGAPPEILQDNALKYYPHDIQGLTNHLKYLINNPDKRKELAQKAHNHIKKEYTIEKAITKMERGYKELLRK